jgi:hypothetical protein
MLARVKSHIFVTDAPIIVTALLGDADFAWADGLRRAHFPPERNIVPAHITLFHHLPPTALDEVKTLVRRETNGVAPLPARTGALINLGRGVAYRIDSPALERVREHLADALHGLLVPQDKARWRPHITIQNKVEPKVAAALHRTLSADFAPRPLTIAGIALWAYRGGPWEPLSRHMFARRAGG